MKQTKENDTDRPREHGAMHCLGTFVGASYSLAGHTGRALAGVPSKIVSLFSKALKRSPRPDKPLSNQEAIRAVVLQELARLQVLEEGKLNLTEFEARLRLMTEAIEALQARVAELGASGSISTADMWDAIGSVQAVKSLNNSERAVLVNIFRQNVALQKPELIDTGIERY